MKKLRKFLTILTTILVVIAVAWTIISLIPPMAAVEGDNPWRKTDQTYSEYFFIKLHLVSFLEKFEITNNNSSSPLLS